MDHELLIATKLFLHIADELQHHPRPALGDSFEEWLFWKIPSREHYRSARSGVARVDVPVTQPIFLSTLWQSLLEHPDLVIADNDIVLGIECKSLQASLEFTQTGVGIPCRTTIDFNSTVPCGYENYKGKFQQYRNLRGKPIRVFYALALYGSEDGEGEDGEKRLLSFLLVDGNYINRDFDLHRKHRNTSRSGFGSYGDGRIRDRKMYIFPNPLTDPELQGSISLIAEDPNLSRIFSQLSKEEEKIKQALNGSKHTFYIYQLR